MENVGSNEDRAGVPPGRQAITEIGTMLQRRQDFRAQEGINLWKGHIEEQLDFKHGIGKVARSETPAEESTVLGIDGQLTTIIKWALKKGEPVSQEDLEDMGIEDEGIILIRFSGNQWQIDLEVDESSGEPLDLMFVEKAADKGKDPQIIISVSDLGCRLEIEYPIRFKDGKRLPKLTYATPYMAVEDITDKDALIISTVFGEFLQAQEEIK